MAESFVLDDDALVELKVISKDGATIVAAGLPMEFTIAQLRTALNSGTAAAPTTTQRGGVLAQATEAAIPAQTVADIAAAQTSITLLVTRYNALLVKLKASGVVANS